MSDGLVPSNDGEMASIHVHWPNAAIPKQLAFRADGARNAFVGDAGTPHGTASLRMRGNLQDSLSAEIGKGEYEAI
jgi:hypothetical protein